MRLIFFSTFFVLVCIPLVLLAAGGYCPDERMSCVAMLFNGVKPADTLAYNAIRNSLPITDRPYVVLGVDGMIKKDVLNSHLSESENFRALKALVNDRRTVEVAIANTFFCRNKDAMVQQGKLGVRYFNELENAIRYANGYTKEQLKAMGFEDKMKRSGAYGITLVPGGERDAEGDGMGSVNGHIFLVLSSDLTARDAARTLAHEGYGHALFFIQGKDFNHSERKTDGGNKPLEDQINSSVKEAERNYDTSHKN